MLGHSLCDRTGPDLGQNKGRLEQVPYGDSKPVDIKPDRKEKHVMQKYKCINEHIQTLNRSVFSVGLNDREEPHTDCRSLFFCCSLICGREVMMKMMMMKIYTGFVGSELEAKLSNSDSQQKYTIQTHKKPCIMMSHLVDYRWHNPPIASSLLYDSLQFHNHFPKTIMF